MSKKNRNRWQKANPVSQPSPAVSEPRVSTSGSVPVPPIEQSDFSPIGPAQLAANRANAQLSTGPRTPEGLARSSKNSVKSALTGRTVLLPTDDVDEYARFLAGFQRDLKPVGQAESELVQIIVDCFWRQRRIQALEYALYAHGHEQFADAFPNCPEADRYNKILLQTQMTYEKQFRNYQIQEARLDRKRAKTMAELERLQAERLEPTRHDGETEAVSGAESDFAPFASEEEFFAALDAGFIPPELAPYMNANKKVSENGFVFSNDNSAPSEPPSSGV